jgi:hypothetical protein
MTIGARSTRVPPGGQTDDHRGRGSDPMFTSGRASVNKPFY